MIKSFRDTDTRHIWERTQVRRIHPNLQRQALRKLNILDAADTLNDLRSPPGNHLEALSRDRDGQHSIRINNQWRICFIWTDSGAEKVEFTDYH